MHQAVTDLCITCGSDFLPKTKRKRRFCSKNCGKRAWGRANGMRWHWKNRERILERHKKYYATRTKALKLVDPDKLKDSALRSIYGISIGDWRALLASQGGVCAICRTGEHGTWYTDHDHATGKVRGILCRGCNLALGFLRDDIENIERALLYKRNGGLPGLKKGAR